jgi:hypothetical protein
MAPKPFADGDAIDTMWDDLVYSYGRLTADVDARDLATRIADLIIAAEDLWKAQRTVWRAETEAQSGVDAINFRTDARTEDFYEDLRHVNRKHPQGEQRQQRYFPVPKYKIIDLGLASQMAYIDDYASSLLKEEEPALQVYGQGFAQDSNDGKLALAALVTAAANRKDQRSKDIAGFRDRANEVRTEIYGELVKRSTKKAKGWSDEFFRRRRQNSPEERRLEKMRETLFGNCEVFSLELDTATKKKILQESNAETLLRWIRNSSLAKTMEELFAG